MRKISHGVVVLLLALMLGMAATSYAQYIANAPFKPQYPKAPDFTLKDTQGKVFKMSAMKGKPVLLFFGTTWCPGCRTEIPKYKKVHETYGPRGLEVIYVNIMEPAAKVSRFVQANSLPYRTLMDVEGDVGQKYNVVGVPTIVLVDREGQIVKVSHTSDDMPLDKVVAEPAAGSKSKAK